MASELLIQDLQAAQTRAAAAADALRSLRQQVQDNARLLESPVAAVQYIEFFVDYFSRAAEELGRVAGELAASPRRAHVDLLRQIASNSAAEQRRSVQFRDKWINRPLPYEEMRPLLTSISTSARDELDALRTLNDTASALEGSMAAPPKDEKGFDRRALFTRLFKPPQDEP
jgi:hypothetical protein